MFKTGLLRHTYECSVKTFRKTYIVEYPRATISETIEYYTDTEDKFVFLYKFLEQFTKKIVKKRFWYHGKMTKAEFLEIGPEGLKHILDEITKTRFFVPPMRSSMDSDTNPPFESFIAFLSEKLCVAPHIIMNEYSFEQAILLSRGVEYNTNMLTEEGKKRNKFLEAWEGWGSSEEDDLAKVVESRKRQESKNNL